MLSERKTEFEIYIRQIVIKLVKLFRKKKLGYIHCVRDGHAPTFL